MPTTPLLFGPVITSLFSNSALLMLPTLYKLPSKRCQPYKESESMNTKIFSRIPPRYWGYLALQIWGAATLLLLRQDAYALNEGAAKSLLLVWSVADQIASSAVHFGAPDLRILLYIPAGFLWTGSIFAAKVFTTLSLALAAWLLYAWIEKTDDSETALITTGLLVISPLTLTQIDTLSPGIYLLLSFALGAWMNNAYRSAPFAFGGWYFGQLFICAVSVSLHPAGLAYPLALLWAWYKEPLDHKQQKYFYIGISFVVLATLLIRMGWNDLEWLQNPIRSLSSIVLGPLLDNEMGAMRWVVGSAILIILTFIVIKQFRSLWSDFIGRTLLIGLLLGAATNDTSWALIAFCMIIFFGFPLMLRSPHSPSGGLIQQRGFILVIIILVSTFFMRADKSHYEIRQLGIISEQDQLIKSLSEDSERARIAGEDSENSAPPPRIRVASQWPSRTMIACKCDTFPLPPAAKDPQAQLTMLSSFSHLMFNPRQTENIILSRNLASIGGNSAETELLLPEGVLLHFNIPGSVNSGK